MPSAETAADAAAAAAAAAALVCDGQAATPEPPELPSELKLNFSFLFSYTP